MYKFVCIFASLLGISLANVLPVQNYRQYLNNNGRDVGDVLEDAHLSMLELITKYGYEGQEHVMQTDDGYILTAHRILPKKERCAGKSPKPPVILQHGLLSSSVDWIILGPSSGLGYILSDLCYDVWLGNSRGNTFSRKHVHMKPEDAEFWDFSWHEMGIYDLPTLIDYVLLRTGSSKLFYVGHSQGTTQYFIMDSLKPEYSEKVIAMMALAPVAYLGHSNSKLLTTIAKFEGVADWITSMMGINEFLPNNQLISDIGGKTCDDEHPNLQSVCENVLFMICGFDPEESNATMLPVIMGHTPAGSATKQLLHYAQSMKYKFFRQWDYGKKGNEAAYGQKEPPEYPLEQSKSHIALWHSDNDFFTAPEDVDILYQRLPNKLGKFKIAWGKFNHLDFLWAIHVKTLVIDPMIDIMERYQGL